MMKDQEDYKMFFLENRLKTFMGWPFEEGCACTPEKVSSIKLTLHHQPGGLGPQSPLTDDTARMMSTVR